MKKIKKILLSVLLISAIGGCFSQNNTEKGAVTVSDVTVEQINENNQKTQNGLLNTNPDPNGEPWLIDANFKLPSAEELEPLEATAKRMARVGETPITLPSKINNSTKMFMRPVFNQIGGSCAQASGVGYAFTYEINRLRGVDGKQASNIYPAGWTYNFMNGATWGGTGVFEGWSIARDNGVPNAVDYGNQVGYNDFRWPKDYNVYKNALSNRVKDYYVKYIKTPDDLYQLKRYLYDHGSGSPDGGLVVFCAGFNPEMVRIPAGQYEAGKWIVKKFVPVNHAVTFVGYDDNVGYDFNADGKITNDIDITGDGIVDMSDWEQGAMIMVNSWGTGWGNSGYSYIPYRLWTLKDSNLWNGTLYVNVAADTQAKYTLKAKISYNKRKRITIKAGYSTVANATAPTVTKTYNAFSNVVGNGGDLQESGIDSLPVEIALDMTAMLSTVDMSKPVRTFLEVTESDSDSTATGQIISTEFVDYTSSSAKTYTSTSSGVEIQNNKITRTFVDVVAGTNTVNVPPVAKLVSANIVETAGNKITIDGSGSTDSDGTITSYLWTQTSGTALVLANTTSSVLSFISPTVSKETYFSFELKVTDNKGAFSTTKAAVIVKPAVIINTNLFSTGLEAADVKLTWTNAVMSTVDVTSAKLYSVTNFGQNSTSSMRYSGLDNSTIRSMISMKAFDVNIPIAATTTLDYWVYAENEAGRYVILDISTVDGKKITDFASAVSTDGKIYSPSQGLGKIGQWVNIKINVGKYLQGKIIDRITFRYNNAVASGTYSGNIDNIKIYN